MRQVSCKCVFYPHGHIIPQSTSLVPKIEIQQEQNRRVGLISLQYTLLLTNIQNAALRNDGTTVNVNSTHQNSDVVEELDRLHLTETYKVKSTLRF